MKWSGREDLGLGRSFDLLVGLINMYKNRYGTISILVLVFGGCIEGYSWRIRWVTPPTKAQKHGQRSGSTLPARGLGIHRKCLSVMVIYN
jgi:hypothetical protein